MPSPATSVTVTLADRAFDPTSVEVPVGGGVDWSSEEQEGHTITASDGSFDSGVVRPGEAFSTTFPDRRHVLTTSAPSTRRCRLASW